TFTMADVRGMGAAQQLWLTIGDAGAVQRACILRVYYEEQENPSVEAPLGDFFAAAWPGPFFQLSSAMVCHNPGSAYCCYWEMPFRRRFRMTFENRGIQPVTLFYQLNYALTEVPDDCAYFHACFRRSNPLAAGAVHPILDGVRGQGHYVGTYIAWGVNNCGWWGEGEVKFYIDGDGEFPTICGTGTEDYFCGAYNFEDQGTHEYQAFCTPYAGLPQIVRPDGLYRSQQRFGMYRWHVPDPVRFRESLRVTIQALGWRSGGRYLPLQDDISSVAYWYQTLPAAPFAPLPGPDALEIV
ncbi:MAG: DUF2961 domain-containing protein, partial [Planctomycetes bacterium]|nr:DUF2961 domain-containing protein [Planctomycetota bacterium]